MNTVVHIITALGSGGAERVLYLVASETAKASNARCVVVSLTDDGIYGPELRRAGVEVHRVGMRNGRIPVTGFIKLVTLLHRLRPDVIMTWLYHADLMGTLAGRLAGVRRIIWNVRCSDMDFSQYSPVTRCIVTLLARVSGLPWAIATNSNAGRRIHESFGYLPKRWVYLPNGFDTELWKPDATDRKAVRRELGFAEHDVVVGMVARVDPQKDHNAFFEALKLLLPKNPQLRVVLIGRGTQELPIPNMLGQFTRALGERRDVPRLMRGLDLLVSSSAYGEGFPNVIGEAMASGVPCVATDVGDTALIIEDSGLVVPPRNPIALASAIDALINRPRDGVPDMSTLARERIRSTFSVESCLRRYSELFRAAAESVKAAYRSA